MAKTSDFESENSGSSPDVAATDGPMPDIYVLTADDDKGTHIRAVTTNQEFAVEWASSAISGSDFHIKKMIETEEQLRELIESFNGYD